MGFVGGGFVVVVVWMVIFFLVGGWVCVVGCGGKWLFLLPPRIESDGKGEKE